MLNFYYKRWLTGTDDAYGLSICEIQYVQWCWTPVFHFISISLYWSGHTREIKINTHTHAQFEKWLWCWRWLWVKERQRKQQKKKKTSGLFDQNCVAHRKSKRNRKSGRLSIFFQDEFRRLFCWCLIFNFTFQFFVSLFVFSPSA